jgi:hypothetical protein
MAQVTLEIRDDALAAMREEARDRNLSLDEYALFLLEEGELSRQRQGGHIGPRRGMIGVRGPLGPQGPGGLVWGRN